MNNSYKHFPVFSKAEMSTELRAWRLWAATHAVVNEISSVREETSSVMLHTHLYACLHAIVWGAKTSRCTMPMRTTLSMIGTGPGFNRVSDNCLCK